MKGIFNWFHRLHPQDTATEPAATELPGTRAKILVVDDERHLVTFIRQTLERQGYLTVVAFDGRESIEKTISEQPDLIVLDIMMPDMDGFDVAQVLHTDPFTSSIPILITEPKPTDREAFESFLPILEEHGVKAHLVKPFTEEALLACVEDILKGYGKGS